jgi:hypothetical protein
MVDLEPDLSGWLDSLPEEMAGHARVLRSVTSIATQDERIRALQVQGSIGRRTADRLSDLDVGMVVADSAWPAILDEIPALVGRLGLVVDAHFQYTPGPENPELITGIRCIVIFDDGIQLDLVVLPGRNVFGSGPEGRTLLDRDDVLRPSEHPMRLADPPTISKWSFLGWQAMTEAAKYLERGKPVAAAEWLNPARQTAISCWAAAFGLDYAGFSIMAAPQLGGAVPWPEGLERTYAGPQQEAVHEALMELAALQERVDRLLEIRLMIPPRPLARWVRSRLRDLKVGPPAQGSQPGPSSGQGNNP